MNNLYKLNTTERAWVSFIIIHELIKTQNFQKAKVYLDQVETKGKNYFIRAFVYLNKELLAQLGYYI